MCEITDWKIFSREEADKQFSPSCWSRVIEPEKAVDSCIKIITSKSEAATASIRNCEFDVPYGDTEREKIDILKPDNPSEDAPILLFFHGGVWQLLCKEQHRFVAPPIIQHGAIVVIVGYTLAPKASLATIIDQCKKATLFVAKRFQKSRGIYLQGHSAGGHLAVMLLSVDWTKHQLPANLIKGVCAFSGIFDVCPLVNTYMNDALKLSLETAWQLSPLNNIQRTHEYNPNAAVYILYGDYDSPSYKQQSEYYHQMLNDAGMTSHCIVLIDADHFEALQNLSDEHYEGTQTLLKMMSIKTY